jgi:hypothetical protein
MKKTFILSPLFVVALLGSPVAHAGADASCHFHGNKPAAESTVLQCAAQYKDKLVESGKLEKSWQSITKAEKIEQIDGARNKEWKLSFKNPSATDQTKSTLFIFYSLPGNFIAANHTGK